METKRRDYFASGTRVVWDVDLLAENVVRKFVFPNAQTPAQVFRRDEIADAQEAISGWRMPVNDLFEPERQDS